MRVIGYLQVRAVGAVTEGAGFAEQEQQVRDWADRHGHEVARIVVDRCSADRPNPGLFGAVRAVRAGHADALVVTSRGRLGEHQQLGVRILAVDQPEPAPAEDRAAGTGRRRATVASTVGIWVAIAVAALVAQGVASAADEKSPPGSESSCVSRQFEVVPCDGDGKARVLAVTDNPARCAFSDWAYPRPNGTWLCLQYP